MVLGLVVLALAQMLGMGRFGLLAALEGTPVHEVTDWSRSLARTANTDTADKGERSGALFCTYLAICQFDVAFPVC